MKTPTTKDQPKRGFTLSELLLGLGRANNCTCSPCFTSQDCPVHGPSWKQAEEYPPIEIKQATEAQ